MEYSKLTENQKKFMRSAERAGYQITEYSGHGMFRVNPAQLRTVEAAAKGAKMTRAAWVRLIVLAAAGQS